MRIGLFTVPGKVVAVTTSAEAIARQARLEALEEFNLDADHKGQTRLN